MFVLTDTNTFSSTLVNVTRFGYIRFDGTSTVENPLTAQQLGMGTPTGAAGPALNAPSINVGGFTIGDARTIGAMGSHGNSFIWQDTIAMSKGRHNARFGVEFKRIQVDKVNSPTEVDGLSPGASPSTTFCWARVQLRTAVQRG